MVQTGSNLKGVAPPSGTGKVSYWRVEGSLLELGAMRPVGYFTSNARSFAERWARRAGMAGMALARPFAYAANRTFATRFLHTLLRGGPQRRAGRACRTTLGKHSPAAGAPFRGRFVYFEPSGISRRHSHGTAARSHRAATRAASLDRQRRHERPYPTRETSDAAWLDGEARATGKRDADDGSSNCSAGQAGRAVRRNSAGGAALRA